MVNSRLKNALWHFYGIHGMSYVEERTKNDTFCIIIRGKSVLIITSANLLDTKYKFYGFNDDLKDTTN